MLKAAQEKFFYICARFKANKALLVTSTNGTVISSVHPVNKQKNIGDRCIRLQLKD